MKYVKPEMKIERFLLCNSIAAVSCETDLVGTSTNFPPQSVYCAFTGDKEFVWASGTEGCERDALAIGYFESGYTATQIETALKNSLVTTAGGPSSESSSLAAGYYVYLKDADGNDCVALAEGTILNYYTNSY